MKSVLLIVCIVLSSIVACSKEPAANKRPPKPHLVEVAIAEKQIVALQRERTGTLKANREIIVQNQEEGSIITHPFYEGDVVKQGELLVQLDDRLLRAQLARTQALRKKARKDLSRIQRLAKRQLTAEVELARVETDLAVAIADEQALTTRVEYASMRSPINGIVSFRSGELGFIAERYTHLLTIADHSTLIAEVTVSELFLNQLSVGDSVAVMIDALMTNTLTANDPLTATITRIYPHIDSSTRTGKIEVSLISVPAGARPGQLARVILRAPEVERILIPFVALRRSVQGDYVFSVKADNTVYKQYIRTGLRINDQVEVLDGLADQARVVVRGFTNLRKDQSVVVGSSPSSLSSPPLPTNE